MHNGNKISRYQRMINPYYHRDGKRKYNILIIHISLPLPKRRKQNDLQFVLICNYLSNNWVNHLT